MLESLLALEGSVHDGTHGLVLLDTRRELSDPAGWDNEIHPLVPGFIHMADTFWVPMVEDALA